jgi:cytochrome c peroxidase
MSRPKIFCVLNLTILVPSLFFAGPSFALIVDQRILDSIPAAEKTPQEVRDQIPRAVRGEKALKHGLSQRQLIRLGEFIFNKVTFRGNGRTCATCHPATNNFTIDPEYIANLPPDDPLFVAENIPALADLEKPAMMRQFGLILENLDGFDKEGVMRGVPATLALRTSITPEEGFLPESSAGWSGDGAPGNGSLREFAIGPVIQHFPKTLNREPGVDFRMPTELELDALLAFQLSLGRQGELNLAEMSFRSPVVERGKELFDSKEEGTGKCKGCHNNAGANSSTTLKNGNRDTGVENLHDQPARLVEPTIPCEGGFGTEPLCNGDICCGFGEGTFNITTVVEAADTPPFFHNNSVNTIEEAVAFYNSDAFNTSPASENRKIHLETTQVVAVAAFCRAINALENIRNSNKLDFDAKKAKIPEGKRILAIAISETEDAIEVLLGGEYALYEGTPVKKLKQALLFEKLAKVANNKNIRNRRIKKAITKKSEARDLIVE